MGLDLESRLARAYLDVCKLSLTKGTYGRPSRFEGRRRWLPYQAASAIAGRFGLEVVRPIRPADRDTGATYATDAETMVGRLRLDNLEWCATAVLRDNVPGDFIETGVWRGGASIFMRAVLQAYGVTDRTVWVADSFEGLPRPNPADFPADAGDECWKAPELAVSLEDVKRNFAKYGLLDEQVQFLKGWFSDTLPAAPVTHLALLRLDGDMYESTTDALEALYPRLSPGGFVIVDDYGALASCKQAVTDYRSKHAITEPIEKIDWTGAFWRRAS